MFVSQVSIDDPVDHHDLQGRRETWFVLRDARAFNACCTERCNFIHGGRSCRKEGVSGEMLDCAHKMDIL